MTGNLPSRPSAYTDENFRRTVVELLRGRGFSVTTAREAGLLGRDDAVHLAYATSSGQVLLTHDRGDFRRLHERWTRSGQQHRGIILLPQQGPAPRIAARAALLLDWWAALSPGPAYLLRWNDIQLRLHAGERLPGYTEDEVRLALGLAEQAAGAD